MLLFQLFQVKLRSGKQLDTEKINSNTLATKLRVRKKYDVHLRECFIRLDRLAPSEISELLNFDSSAQNSPKKRISTNNKYNLRQRLVKEKKVEVLNVQKSQLNAVALKNSGNAYIKYWNKAIRGMKSKKTELNQIILAKMRSYKPWPATMLTKF